MKRYFERIMDFIPLISNRTKLMISASLVGCAFILYFVRPGLDSTLCLIAMIFAFIGDISLNGMPLEKRPKKLMYIGAGFFMVAHLVYASAFNTLLTTSVFFNPGAIAGIVFIALMCITLIVCTRKAKEKLSSTMFIVFGIYCLIIGINFVTIASYSYTYKSIAVIGALSFLISDFIIGMETLFKIKNPILRKLVWIFYPLGQFIILSCR
jgi:uncharacterized membrane protein YhhN